MGCRDEGLSYEPIERSGEFEVARRAIDDFYGVVNGFGERDVVSYLEVFLKGLEEALVKDGGEEGLRSLHLPKS